MLIPGWQGNHGEDPRKGWMESGAGLPSVGEAACLEVASRCLDFCHWCRQSRPQTEAAEAKGGP